MEKKKLDMNQFEGTVDSKMQYAVFKDQNLDRETIKNWLIKDIRGTYITMSELLSSRECIEALTDVFYKRYVDFHAKQQANPELDLKQEVK